ncbi:MAG: hypothetical protein B7Y78_12300, partial [Caulobacter sp. 35-67-4]
AIFHGADLRGADFSGAVLGGADLSGARGLDQDQLDEACGDGSTRLPRGLSVRSCHGDRRHIRVVVDFEHAKAQAAAARAAAAAARAVPKPPAPPKPPKY